MTVTMLTSDPWDVGSTVPLPDHDPRGCWRWLSVLTGLTWVFKDGKKNLTPQIKVTPFLVEDLKAVLLYIVFLKTVIFAS